MIEAVVMYLNVFRDAYIRDGVEDIPLDTIMDEVSDIAINNWIARESRIPDLTTDQINKALTRALARTYNSN